MKNLAKIDKFYFVLGIVLIILSVIFIYTFRGIFTSFISAYEVNPRSSAGNKIDTIKLEKAQQLIFGQQEKGFIEETSPTLQAIATPIPTGVPTSEVQTQSAEIPVQ